MTQRYLCSTCHRETRRWSSRCPHCSAWHSIITDGLRSPIQGWGDGEFPEPVGDAETFRPAVPITDIRLQQLEVVYTGIEGLDRVLSTSSQRPAGGAVLGGAVVLGGEPGKGKSTILLQACANVARREETCLFLSAEENDEQLKEHAARIGALCPDLHASFEKNLAHLPAEIVRLRPRIVVVDSIQKVHLSDVDSPPGSIGQLKACTDALVDLCKRERFALFIVGHVSKDGDLAGPQTLKHLVDTVLEFFEPSASKVYGTGRRLLRVAGKNRLGREDQRALFEMTERGLVDVPFPTDAPISDVDS